MISSKPSSSSLASLASLAPTLWGTFTVRGQPDDPCRLQHTDRDPAAASNESIPDQASAPSAGTTLTTNEQTSLKAQLVFDASWKAMEDRFGGKYVSPREIVWLNGAPGSGKGTNVPFIMRSRGLSRSVGMSQLLDSPEI